MSTTEQITELQKAVNELEATVEKRLGEIKDLEQENTRLSTAVRYYREQLENLRYDAAAALKEGALP